MEYAETIVHIADRRSVARTPVIDDVLARPPVPAMASTVDDDLDQELRRTVTRGANAARRQRRKRAHGDNPSLPSITEQLSTVSEPIQSVPSVSEPVQSVPTVNLRSYDKDARSAQAFIYDATGLSACARDADGVLNPQPVSAATISDCLSRYRKRTDPTRPLHGCASCGAFLLNSDADLAPVPLPQLSLLKLSVDVSVFGSNTSVRAI